jgi:hypothetical protein
LEAAGRPSGTGRSTSSSESRRDERFEDALDQTQAHRAEERRRSDRSHPIDRDDHARRPAARERGAEDASEDPRPVERRSSGRASDEKRPTGAANVDRTIEARSDDGAKLGAGAKSSETAAHDRKPEARAPRATATDELVAIESGGSPPKPTDLARAIDALAAKSIERPAQTRTPLVPALAATPLENESELPVQATGGSGIAEASTARPGANVERPAFGPDEAAAKSASDAPAPDANAAEHPRFELRELARSSDVARAQAPLERASAQAHAPEILHQIRLNFAPGTREAVLQLEPEHLGRISIKLAVERGTLRAQVRAEKSETLAVLQHHAPELRAMLESRGITPERVDFQLGLDRGRRDRSSEGGDGRSARHDQLSPAAPVASRALRALAAGAWGVDTYA